MRAGLAALSLPVFLVASCSTPEQVANGRSNAVAVLDRAVGWLVEHQNPNGSWATPVIEGLLDSNYSVASYYDWQYAASSLACLALLESPETSARRRALEKGLVWLASSRLPKRGSDWDNDTIWAALYGVVATVAAIQDPRFARGDLRRVVEARGRELLGILLRNQVPTGGWGYYDFGLSTRRPKWATSFSTALVLPALEAALRLGWFDDRRVLARAVAYVRRCQLPNGAYEYDLRPIPRAPAGEHINKIKGSLGRIQVCNWALRSCGDPSVSLDKIRTGLEPFFEHHRFLDIARMRPIPHEAYYANAGYFYFFGHFYAARAINLLPEAERETWHARLRPHVIKTQRRDGSFCDYLGQGYEVVAGTAFASLVLNAGL